MKFFSSFAKSLLEEMSLSKKSFEKKKCPTAKVSKERELSNQSCVDWFDLGNQCESEDKEGYSIKDENNQDDYLRWYDSKKFCFA